MRCKKASQVCQRTHWCVSSHKHTYKEAISLSHSGREANSEGHFQFNSLGRGGEWGTGWISSCSVAPVGKTERSEGLWPVTSYAPSLPRSCQAECQEIKQPWPSYNPDLHLRTHLQHVCSPWLQMLMVVNPLPLHRTPNPLTQWLVCFLRHSSTHSGSIFEPRVPFLRHFNAVCLLTGISVKVDFYRVEQHALCNWFSFYASLGVLSCILHATPTHQRVMQIKENSNPKRKLFN